MVKEGLLMTTPTIIPVHDDPLITASCHKSGCSPGQCVRRAWVTTDGALIGLNKKKRI